METLEKELLHESSRNLQDIGSDSECEDAKNHIPLDLYESPEDISRDDDTMGQCPCCYKIMPINCFVVYTCGHFSCDACINNMKAVQGEHKCHLCRKDIVSDEHIYVSSRVAVRYEREYEDRKALRRRMKRQRL